MLKFQFVALASGRAEYHWKIILFNLKTNTNFLRILEMFKNTRAAYLINYYHAPVECTYKLCAGCALPAKPAPSL